MKSFAAIVAWVATNDYSTLPLYLQIVNNLPDTIDNLEEHAIQFGKRAVRLVPDSKT